MKPLSFHAGPEVTHSTNGECAESDQSVAQLHAMLAEGEVNMLWAQSRAMTMEQAIAFALE